MLNSIPINEYLNKEVLVKIDRPLNSKHPKHNFVYKVNYGFIENTKQEDGEELDAYVLGPEIPLEEFKGKCVAYIERIDDPNDPKLVVVSNELENITDEDILKKVSFQEKWFEPVVKRG